MKTFTIVYQSTRGGRMLRNIVKAYDVLEALEMRPARVHQYWVFPGLV